MFTIYNPVTYLTTPHKSKIKGVCAIGMKSLENNTDFNDAEEMMEYRLNTVSQAEFKSLKESPKAIKIIEKCLGSDIDSLPCVAWSYPIHSSSIGLTEKFARIVALSFTDFTSNYKQHPRLIGNRERSDNN